MLTSFNPCAGDVISLFTLPLLYSPSIIVLLAACNLKETFHLLAMPETGLFYYPHIATAWFGVPVFRYCHGTDPESNRN
jgi:hypothetical protein